MINIEEKKVLDVCCGSKMFWFDKNDDRALFIDNRCEDFILKDKSSKNGFRKLSIKPDMIGDFTNLNFKNESFNLVVFDPPHLINNGESGWLAKKYGKLNEDWKLVIKKGFEECFRVCKKNGVVIFKWNETDIKLQEILSLTEKKPLFGNKGGKNHFTHWIVFIN